MLKELTRNTPLIDELKQMASYLKFKIDLMTKNWIDSFKPINNVNQYSAIACKPFVENKDDSRAFRIPCNILCFSIAKSLSDLASNIKFKSLVVYMMLGLGFLKSTLMRHLMVNHSVRKPEGILRVVLVRVELFIFPDDFVILDSNVDFEMPII